MTQIIGPFDGRKARRKRCNRCVERRIKCVGGVPCENCCRTGRTCQLPAKKAVTAPIFVHRTQATFASTADSEVKIVAVALPQRAPLSPSDAYLDYFFTHFLYQNAFTSISPQFANSLVTFLHHSSELHDAVKAIAALHISHSTSFLQGRDDPAALQAYSRSVRSLQTKLELESTARDPSVLWATLLLGVFELMRDPTGANWLAHFLHGTSTMLLLLGPTVLTTPSEKHAHCQAFFFSARVFELSRALIYTEHTFLSTSEWSAAIESYWVQNQELRTPKEALFDITPLFGELGMRVLDFVDAAGGMSVQKQVCFARALALEGLSLQETLLRWHAHSSLHSLIENAASAPNEDTLIAQAYYHALSIYLDGTFSYHAPFTSSSAPKSPMLDRFSIDEHVSCILSACQQLLDQRCAGLVLFFPLRVAGARARDSRSQGEILRLLGVIAQRGFMVAQSFVEDLSDLWAQ